MGFSLAGFGKALGDFSRERAERKRVEAKEEADFDLRQNRARIGRLFVPLAEDGDFDGAQSLVDKLAQTGDEEGALGLTQALAQARKFHATKAETDRQAGRDKTQKNLFQRLALATSTPNFDTNVEAQGRARVLRQGLDDHLAGGEGSVGLESMLDHRKQAEADVAKNILKSTKNLGKIMSHDPKKDLVRVGDDGKVETLRTGGSSGSGASNPKISAELNRKLKDMQSFNEGAQKLLKKLGDPNLRAELGPFSGNVNKFLNSHLGGVGVSPEVQSFGADLYNISDLYLRERTGAAITPVEFRRAMTQILGDLDSTPEALAIRLRNAIQFNSVRIENITNLPDDTVDRAILTAEDAAPFLRELFGQPSTAPPPSPQEGDKFTFDEGPATYTAGTWRLD